MIKVGTVALPCRVVLGAFLKPVLVLLLSEWGCVGVALRHVRQFVPSTDIRGYRAARPSCMFLATTTSATASLST